MFSVGCVRFMENDTKMGICIPWSLSFCIPSSCKAEVGLEFTRTRKEKFIALG